MKKFLSLALALVMTMSLGTISAGAEDFTDSEAITYQEAVEVLTDIGVIDGYTDGSFGPKGGLTRGAAAKIICNLILGPTTADALTADTAPYSDVPADHTFAGYIAYCQKEGIVDGYADGSFKPAAPLSGYAFMKMLLGALGYDGEVEGYTGANWSVNVAKRALNVGLDNGLVTALKGNDPVDRETACQFALNTLKADMVEYDSRTSVSVGGANVIVGGSEAKPSKANKNDGKIDGEKEGDGVLQFAEQYFGDLKLTAGNDEFGRPANTWFNKSKEIGTYSRVDLLVETVEGNRQRKTDLYKIVGKSVYDALRDGDAKLTVYMDGKDNKTEVEASAIDTWMHKTNTGYTQLHENGDLMEVYIDKNSNVTIVMVRTYLYRVVGDYDSKKDVVTLTPATSTLTLDATVKLSSEEFPSVTGLKDEDYVLVTGTVKGSVLTPKTLEKAQLVTGEVTGYKVNNSDSTGTNVVIGGKTYLYNVTAGDAAKTSYTVGKSATVVLDKYGFIIAVDEAVVLTDYVFVEKFAATSGLNAKAVAALLFADGKTEEAAIRELADENLTGSALLQTENYNGKYAAKWYRYSKNANGEYTLYDVDSAKYTQAETLTYKAEGEAKTVTVNSKVLFLAGQKNLADDDTVVIVRDKDDKITTYTGVTNIPEIVAAAGTTATVYQLVNQENGYTSVCFIDLDGKAAIAGASSSKLVYVVKYDGEYKTSENEIYYTYIVRENGEEITVKADSKIAGTGLVLGVANYLTKNTDGLLTDFALVTENDGVDTFAALGATAPVAYSAGTLTIDGKEFVVAKDAKIDLYVTLPELMMDEDADYEASEGITAKVLSDTLKNREYSYDYVAVTSDKAGEVLSELIITVNAPAEQ